MDECYELGLKIGKDWYMKEVAELNMEVINREEEYVTNHAIKKITMIIMMSGRRIPRHIFDGEEYLNAFLMGMYNGSKRYKRGMKNDWLE